MVDVARFIAVRPRVDDGFRIDREQEGVVVLRILAVVARVGFLVADPIAEVLDDGGSFANPAQCEHTVAVHGRVAYFNHRPLPAPALAHTAIGALIAA